MVRNTRYGKIFLVAAVGVMIVGVLATLLYERFYPRPARPDRPPISRPRPPTGPDVLQPPTVPLPQLPTLPRVPGPPPVAAAPCPPAPGGEEFDNGARSFAIRFEDEVSPYCVLAVFVMPGETLPLEIAYARSPGGFTIDAPHGELLARAPRKWRWLAPMQKGLYPVTITDPATSETITLNVFVLAPYHGAEVFNGYRIGRYQRKPLRGDPAYRMPAGFVEVTPQNQDTWVSPHFQLKQFLCKQADGFPKYLILRERLLIKLEILLEHANERGWRADTFFVMSAFRTPWYNRAIGNTTSYSRHSYGDAADVYIDHDRDGTIDDLDGDGKITFADGKALHDMIDSLSSEAWYAPFEGGLHVYPATPAHGPMVHVDTRGNPSRW